MTRATFILLACNVLLWAMVCQTNHTLAPWHMSVFAGGLLVSFGALRLGFREGWWTSILIGLLVDSSAAVYFGFHAMIFAIAHTLIYNFRGRFPREETIAGVAVAIITNTVLFLMITLALIHRCPEPSEMILRLLCDLLVSSLFILIAAPWFFALQERSLELCGVSLRREQRGLL